MNNYKKYDISEYISNLEKWMEEAKKLSGCNDTELETNYKVMSTIIPVGGQYNYIKTKVMNKSVMNLLKILRMEEVKALDCKTNEAAYLYCQLRFYKEYLEEQYVEIQEEKDEFKEYYVLSNYKQHLVEGFEEYYIIEDVDNKVIRNKDERIFLVLKYKEDPDDEFVIKEPRAESLGFIIFTTNTSASSKTFNEFTSELNPFK
mgnify:CR=1 FL=1